NMVASSRLLFAMGRRNLIDHRMGHIHARNQTPSTAVIIVGITSAMAVFLGQAGLVPILEVGAVTSALGWMSACASYFCMKPGFGGRAAAIFGVFVTSLMILVKVIPTIPVTSLAMNGWLWQSGPSWEHCCEQPEEGTGRRQRPNLNVWECRPEDPALSGCKL